MVYGSGTITAMVALVTARRATAITDRRRGRAATTTARRIHRATPTAATTVRLPAITATDDPAATQSPKRGKSRNRALEFVLLSDIELSDRGAVCDRPKIAQREHH